MEAAWSITDLPPAAPGILLLLLLVELGLLGSSPATPKGGVWLEPVLPVGN